MNFLHTLINLKIIFISHGINGSWALGIFQDSELRIKNQLRSKFSNPWFNFSASGTSLGTIMNLSSNLDMAFTVSSGRKKISS